MDSPVNASKIILVTGPSGAGRTTAIKAFEDIDYEVIDNLPFSLMNRLFDGAPLERPIALGVDVRNRDFSAEKLKNSFLSLKNNANYDAHLLFLDCDEDILIRRYSETRRRHPLSVEDTLLEGIRHERVLLAGLWEVADELIDTSEFSPHELRAEITSRYRADSKSRLQIQVQSFSYKRGLPRSSDYVFDCRFIQNPHWQPELRALTGQDSAVASYVFSDPNTFGYFDKIQGICDLVIPASISEGKAHLSFSFGCTGGQHRSVALAEKLTANLHEAGYAPVLRHRELERLGLYLPNDEMTGDEL